MRNKIIHCSVFLFLCLTGFSPADSNATFCFDFNDHQFKEAHNKISIKPVGVTLTEDRFGNKQSAAYLHGNTSSYLNLGTSNFLKPKTGSISLWVNIQAKVLAGKGYQGNPLIMTRNGPGEDFHFAYGIGYSLPSNRFGAQTCKDSIQETIIFSKDTVSHNTWYHLVLTYDNHYSAFYVNSELQGKLIKGFESVFLEGDSVIMGRSLGYKNERFSHAIIDDIRFYHRVLTEKEIEALFNEPNPNRFKNALSEVLRYGLIVLALGLVIVLLIIRNKRNLKRQKEHYELHNRINELEAKAVRAQMNPHFISNSMAAVQNLIYDKEFEKASQYLAKLTFLMRQVLNFYDKTYISLEEELAFVKLNVELEQLRFNTNFSFNIFVQDGIDLQQIIIPSLITQPLIENAIWHGLLPLKEREPRLDIRVYIKNNITFIAIEDNGIGRPKPATAAEKDSKGIKLITDKIESINQLRNSADFKLEIIDLFDKNNLPAGTKIIIQLLNYTLEE